MLDALPRARIGFATMAPFGWPQTAGRAAPTLGAHRGRRGILQRASVRVVVPLPRLLRLLLRSPRLLRRVRTTQQHRDPAPATLLLQGDGRTVLLLLLLLSWAHLLNCAALWPCGLWGVSRRCATIMR